MFFNEVEVCEDCDQVETTSTANVQIVSTLEAIEPKESVTITPISADLIEAKLSYEQDKNEKVEILIPPITSTS